MSVFLKKGAVTSSQSMNSQNLSTTAPMAGYPPSLTYRLLSVVSVMTSLSTEQKTVLTQLRSLSGTLKWLRDFSRLNQVWSNSFLPILNLAWAVFMSAPSQLLGPPVTIVMNCFCLQTCFFMSVFLKKGEVRSSASMNSQNFSTTAPTAGSPPSLSYKLASSTVTMSFSTEQKISFRSVTSFSCTLNSPRALSKFTQVWSNSFFPILNLSWASFMPAPSYLLGPPVTIVRNLFWLSICFFMSVFLKNGDVTSSASMNSQNFQTTAPMAFSPPRRSKRAAVSSNQPWFSVLASQPIILNSINSTQSSMQAINTTQQYPQTITPRISRLRS